MERIDSRMRKDWVSILSSEHVGQDLPPTFHLAAMIAQISFSFRTRSLTWDAENSLAGIFMAAKEKRRNKYTFADNCDWCSQ